MLTKKIKEIWLQKQDELNLTRIRKVEDIERLQAELTALDAQIAEQEAEILEIDTLEIKSVK